MKWLNRPSGVATVSSKSRISWNASARHTSRWRFACSRPEWFLNCTETDEIRLVSASDTGQQTRSKILYPTDGTVIAMDPDIPVKHQRVQFSSRGGEEVAWLIDGTNVGNGIDVGWTPTGGRHRLR